MDENTITLLTENSRIRIKCDSAAPVVANGAFYLGCQLDKDHEEKFHEIKIRWK